MPMPVRCSHALNAQTDRSFRPRDDTRGTGSREKIINIIGLTGPDADYVATMEMEKPSSPRADRTMSIKSEAAVSTVQELTARFRSLQDQLKEAAEVVGSENVTLPELFAAKLELAQIVGRLEQFQFDEVDAVATHHLTSGKDEVRQQRKSLTRAVTALGEEAASKHEAVAARIKSMAAKVSDHGEGR